MVESNLENQMLVIEERINEIEQTPATTLDIIGRETEEKDWEAFLVYFLNKDNPHGFGTDVLEAFLKAISSHEWTVLSGPVHDLEQVKIESQVSTGSGPVDILLWLKDEWYICIEMKAKSPETNEQTVRYAEANKLGELVVSQHNGVEEYIYLAPENAASPTADEFVEVSWKHIVDHFENVLVKGYGQYPSKSSAQLTDYLDTIRQELNMDNINTISEETKLYLEYSKTIDRIIDQYESDKDRIFRGISDAFFSKSGCERGEWKVSNRAEEYIKFYKPKWQSLEGNVSIEYEPHVHLLQTRPEIRLRLDIEGGNKKEVRSDLLDRLDQNQRQEIDEKGWKITDGSFHFIAKSISLDWDNTQKSIFQAVHELHELREIVEPHIENIVAERWFLLKRRTVVVG